MKTKPFLLHALSPLHAGTGQAAGVVDLPIARLRSTGIPIVPGSSIKGVLRDALGTDEDEPKDEQRKNKLHAVFGPSIESASDHAGALVVSDARLLALPVRSFRGTFAWVSSPLLLDLALRDLKILGESDAVLDLLATPDVSSPRTALVRSIDKGDSLNVHESTNGERKEHSVPLEDLDFEAKASSAVEAWAKYLGPFVAPVRQAMAPVRQARIFEQRFIVVADEAMTFLWETATQIDTRVRLDPRTRTVARGALWTEESLPPETLMIGILAAERARRDGVSLKPVDVLEIALEQEQVLQFGGKATVGRGRCRIVPLTSVPDAEQQQ